MLGWGGSRGVPELLLPLPSFTHHDAAVSAMWQGSDNHCLTTAGKGVKEEQPHLETHV